MRTPAIISALLLALLSLVPRSLAPVAVAAVESVDQPIIALPVEFSGEPIEPEFTGLPQDPEFVIPEIKLPEVPAPAEPPPHDYGCDTFPVRYRGYLTNGQPRFRNGSAVSVGGGKFITAAHGTNGFQSGYVVEVQIGPDWHKATTVRPDPQADVLEAVISKTDVAGVMVRAPEYGERVTVYGLTTCKPMRGGFFADVVGLDAAEPGVESGDSGGGVYGEDGALVAIVSGHGKDHRSLVVEPLGRKPVQQAPKAAPQPTPAPVQAAPVRSACPGGICPAPQSAGQLRTVLPRRGRK